MVNVCVRAFKSLTSDFIQVDRCRCLQPELNDSHDGVRSPLFAGERAGVRAGFYPTHFSNG